MLMRGYESCRQFTNQVRSAIRHELGFLLLIESITTAAVVLHLSNKLNSATVIAD
jgi:hypothetical protein